MFYRLRKRWAYYCLSVAQRSVLNTAPVKAGNEGGPIILTQLCHRDVLMYLVAIKSFVRFLPASRICILGDGSLNVRDVELLRQHISGVEIFGVEEFRGQRYPDGGCWERLAALITLSAEGYAMQLDADTITLNMPQEVCEAVSSKMPFTLGTAQGTEVVSASQAAMLAAEFITEGDGHVQTLAESVLDKFPDVARLRYIRGCAAFTGVPEKSLEMDVLESWSERFEEKVGRRWHEWGTEQFMSNFLIANIANTRVLNRSNYAGCSGGIHADQIFVHFAGYCRFDKNRYHYLSKQVVAQLCAAQ